MSAPVVIAYDGSDGAARAIACAGSLLAPRPALVVHSHAGLPQRVFGRSLSGDGPLAEAAAEFDAGGDEEAARLAEEGAELAAAAGFEPGEALAVRDSRPWRAVIDAAHEHNAAAIVTGARGRSSFASVVLGSVSSGIVHHSPVPVLVVPATAANDGREEPALLAYDGSERAAGAIARASELLRGRAAIVLNLWESWSAHAPTYVPVIHGAVGEMARELDEIAVARSAETADGGVALAEAAGFEAKPLSAQADGPRWREVLNAAEDSPASVIVLGIRGLTGLPAVLGSVSHGVVHHSHQPVLLVPEGGS